MHCDTTDRTLEAYGTCAPDDTLSEAIRYVTEYGWAIVPTWTVMPDGTCECAAPECTHPGKHPRTDNGSLDASTDLAVIRSWYTKWSRAGVGVDLERSNLVDIAPDSATWLATFRGPGYGLPRTPHFASGGGVGHEHHVYQRPETCPARRICMSGQYDILSKGIAVLPPSRGRYWLANPDQTALAVVPLWAVDRLRAAEGKQVRTREAARQAAVGAEGEPPVRLTGDAAARWRGELVNTGGSGEDGVDRSGSLFRIGLDLARANATYRTILEAVRERDLTLGWGKYSARADAEERYAEIAAKALTEVLAPKSQSETLGSLPQHQIGEPGPANGSCSPHCERHHARIATLEQDIQEIRRRDARRAQFFRRKDLNANTKHVANTLLSIQAWHEQARPSGREVDDHGHCKDCGSAERHTATCPIPVTITPSKDPDHPEREEWTDNTLTGLSGLSKATVQRELSRLTGPGGLWQKDPRARRDDDGRLSGGQRLRLVATAPVDETWNNVIAFTPPEKAQPVASNVARCDKHPFAPYQRETTNKCTRCGRHVRPPRRTLIDPTDSAPPKIIDPQVTGSADAADDEYAASLFAPKSQSETLEGDPKTVTVVNRSQSETLGDDVESQCAHCSGPNARDVPSRVLDRPIQLCEKCWPSDRQDALQDYACHGCGAFADDAWGPVVQVNDVWLHAGANAPCKLSVAS